MHSAYIEAKYVKRRKKEKKQSGKVFHILHIQNSGKVWGKGGVRREALTIQAFSVEVFHILHRQNGGKP